MLAVVAGGAPASAAPAPPPRNGTIAVALDRVVNRFAPDRAFGAGVDGQRLSDLGQIYSRPNLRAMRSAGLSALTYRLRTELAVEAWHWNPLGRWSDARRQQGYWTSSSRPGPRFDVSFGYRLPRRGDTVDQANDDGFSRLDDGDPRSFWKSNPYLDPVYTGRDHGLHPQWAMLDLGRRRQVDAVRVDWGTPYATRFAVEYWAGKDAFSDAINGHWQRFPAGPFRGRPGSQTVSLGPAPYRVRFMRVVFLASSHTAPPGSTDRRDRLGYAVRELAVGQTVGGRLLDLLSHAASHKQTLAYVSSTDPWHRAQDIDPGIAQPSFDRVLASGLAKGMPILLPVAMLYGTPADAVAELRYLGGRRYRVGRVELGEEPDNQFIAPEDYGALYVRFARALHHAYPRIPLGGPSFATSIPEWEYWPNATGNTSWINRFLAYLRAHRARRQLGFFSFEWYPVDDVCRSPAQVLLQAPDLLADQLRRVDQAGLPRRLPRLISEYGYSSSAARAEVDLPGALLNADIVGDFLALGGSGAYLYGYEPSPLMHESGACDTWGNLTLLQSDEQHRVRHPLATYYTAQLLTRRWVEPGGRMHRMYMASSDLQDAAGQALVTAYALRRPDRRLSLLLINKDPARKATVRVALASGGRTSPAAGRLDLYQLSGRQYKWRPANQNGSPSPDGPPAHLVLKRRSASALELPPYSLSVAVWGRPM